MIDIHSHIIHGVDDGSESIDESVAIIKRALEHGIKAMFATPHYLSEGFVVEVEENKKRLNEIKNRLKEENIDVELFLGNEIFLDHEILNYLKDNKATSLNDSRYVLIELPMMQCPNYLEDSIFSIKLNGMIPIIAHPERYVYVQRDTEIVKKWIEMGALMQLNLSSVRGRYGEEVQKTAIKLLKRDMIHFVASDVHKLKSSVLSVERPLDIVKEIVGNDRFHEIVTINGKKIISNDLVEAYEVKEEKISLLKKIISLVG